MRGALSDSGDESGIIAAGNVGSAKPYHLYRDCHQLDSANRTEPVDAETIERYGMRRCSACDRRRTEEEYDL